MLIKTICFSNYFLSKAKTLAFDRKTDSFVFLTIYIMSDYKNHGEIINYIYENIVSREYSNDIKEKNIEIVIYETMFMCNVINTLKDYFLSKGLLKSNKIAHYIAKNFILIQKLIDFENDKTIIPLVKYDDYYCPNDIIEIRFRDDDIHNIKNLLYQMMSSYQYEMSTTKYKLITHIHKSNVKFEYYDVYYMSRKRYDKLMNIYINNKHDIKLFKERTFKALLRHNIYDFHMGLSIQTFQLIETELAVNFELFSSPINNYFDNYSSPYLDTDKFFGSSGDFFQVYPKLFINGGSFEAFPPRVEEYIGVFATIISEELQKSEAETGTSVSSEKALSFFIVIPYMPYSLAHKIFYRSKYCVYSLINIEYIDCVENSSFTNQLISIFILQNEEGRHKYKVTDNLIKGLKTQFKYNNK